MLGWLRYEQCRVLEQRVARGTTITRSCSTRSVPVMPFGSDSAVVCLRAGSYLTRRRRVVRPSSRAAP
jgi:hypothetical protein